MKKLIPLMFGLMLPLTGAFADDFTDEAVAFCRSKGGNYTMGSMVEEGSKYCRQVTCKKTNSDRYEIPEGATGPEANVEATKRVCVDKSVVDGSFNTNGTGNGNGSNSSNNGPGPGTNTNGSASGTNQNDRDDGSYICEELEGEGRIEKGGLCYRECKPRRSILGIVGPKKEGFERKSCVECLLKYPGVYRVKKEYLPKDRNGKIIGDKSVSLGKGVTVKTGVIVCKDSKGNVISVTGSSCPSGSVLYSGNGNVRGNVGSGNGVGANGTIIIAGGAGANGGIQRPAYCDSDKASDLKLCEKWMKTNQRFLCSAGGNPAFCVEGYSEISSRYDTRDCVNCQVGGRKQNTLSGVAEIVGALAPPLAHFGAAYVGARAYQKGQEAWAGAAVAGFEQCQISQNNYMQYLSANELPGLSPAQQAAMGCNGFSLGGYAGLQNGGLNGWYGAGYTPGMIGGMMGPYGGYGMTGGVYPGGMMAAGMMTGGMMAGGMYPGAMAGGMMTGGMYPGGMAGGMVNGISIAGGINAGGMYPGGMMTGGMMNGGMYPGGMMTGGMVNGGYIAGGMMNGGMMPGGYMAGGYMAGGMMQGGYAGGMMAGGYMAGGMMGGNYQASQGAANIDGMLQQQGASYQMGGIMNGMNSGSYFGAGGHPMNAGFQIGGQIGMGMYPHP